MRIRSIKYKSSTTNIIDQTNLKPHSFYSRVNLMNSNATESQPNININAPKHKARQIFTEQCLNFEHQQDTQTDLGFQNRQEFFVNGVDHRVGIRSEKIASKISSLHQEIKIHIDKENRTSIFHVKNKGLIKGLESLSIHQNKSPKVDRIRFRLSKFSQNNQQHLDINKKSHYPSDQNNEIPEKQEIILGQNLTYNFQSLQNDLSQIAQQTRKQHNRIEKIKKEMNLLGPKVQRQLDRILIEFRKCMENINNCMSKAKTEKCTILMNWRSVINEKSRQYREEQEIIECVSLNVDRVRSSIEGNGINCITVEIEDIDIEG